MALAVYNDQNQRNILNWDSRIKALEHNSPEPKHIIQRPVIIMKERRVASGGFFFYSRLSANANIK